MVKTSKTSIIPYYIADYILIHAVQPMKSFKLFLRECGILPLVSVIERFTLETQLSDPD